jgi:presenilin-like A22 family membrane protease
MAKNPENIGEEKKVLPFSFKILLFEAILFSSTLALGIFSAKRAYQCLAFMKEIERTPVSPWEFLFSFFLISLIFFLAIKFLKFKKGKSALFKIIFVLAIFFGGILLINIWLPLDISAILMAFFIFWWLKEPSVFIQNLCLILGMAGVGVTLGLRFEPNFMVIILILLSIYDWIAVYKTKHMVKMAKAMIEMGAIPALVIPQKISGFKSHLVKVRPGGEFLILGGGDVVFPLIFSISLIPYGILKSSIVAFFSLIGVLMNFFIFLKQKERKPIPALPLISLFSIIGYLITKLI